MGIAPHVKERNIMIGDILSDIFMPHVIVFLLMFRIAMSAVDASGAFREDMRSLWQWVKPHWCKMVAHPLYWAATGIVTAYLLVGVFL